MFHFAQHIDQLDRRNTAMQWVGAAILIGLLALLLIGGALLARSEKTPKSRPSSPYEDLYRSKGMGSVLDANQQLSQFSSGEHRRHRDEGRKQHKHKVE
jgi:hypothetical protein